jgi:tetratricopeptide (TPR) repeat protein
MKNAFVLLSIALALVACRPAAETAVPASVLLETAGTLAERGFPAQAREMYLQVLAAPGLAAEERANAAYLLAELEMNKLGDPAGAYAHYLLAQTLGPSDTVRTGVQAGMVAALERAGRSLAAADLLKDSTALVPSTAPSGGGKTLATIGGKPVTEAEVKTALDAYPEPVKAQFQGDEGLKRFARQYVAMKVVLDAARRAGLDKDAKVAARMALMQEDLLKQAYLEREISGKVTITETDARAWYEAHKERFKDAEKQTETPFEQVKDLCLSQARQEKQAALIDQAIDRLLKAADAQFTDAP